MVKIIPSIASGADFESQGKRIYNEIYILDEADIDYSQLPVITESAAERSMAALTLVSGATGWQKFSFAKHTAANTDDGQSGDITSSATDTISGTIGGESIALDNFLQQIGKPVLVCLRDRITGDLSIHGRPYSPMRFSAFSKRKNADNTSADVTFTNETLYQPLKYLGSVNAPTGGSQGGDGGDGEDGDAQ